VNDNKVCYVCTYNTNYNGLLEKTVQFHVYIAGKLFGIFIYTMNVRRTHFHSGW
jgi:hypothetical protein